MAGSLQGKDKACPTHVSLLVDLHLHSPGMNTVSEERMHEHEFDRRYRAQLFGLLALLARSLVPTLTS